MILQPLFEEMNRTRRLLALTGAALAAVGIASWLPDLPGQGDHPAAAFEWARGKAAVDELSAQLDRPNVLAIRGGGLFAGAAAGRSTYLLAPVEGRSLWRDLLRARVAADGETGMTTTTSALEEASAGGATVELAGHAIDPALAAALKSARSPERGPSVRIAAVGDADGADAALAGPPVWRQAEPADARALASALAADVAAWIASR